MKKFYCTGFLLISLISCKKDINENTSSHKEDFDDSVYDHRIIDSLSEVFSKTINQEDLKRHVSKLASEEFEGRGTGLAGGLAAANYIKDFYTNNEIKNPAALGGYFQKYEEFPHIWQSFLSVIQNEQSPDEMAFFNPFTKQSIDIKTKNIVFLGYGIEDNSYSDFSNINTSLENYVAIIGYGAPNAELKKNWPLKRKLELLSKKGCIGVIYKNTLGPSPNVLPSTEGPGFKYALPVIGVGLTGVDDFLNKADINYREALEKINSDLKSRSAFIPRVSVDIKQRLVKGESPVYNVISEIPGSDLKNEYIILSAHYDHLGIKYINDIKSFYPGADDNASGTAAIMEIAEAFKLALMQGHKPRRTVVFISFTGEELGLMGSKYYVEHPVYPLKKTVANINVDMLGRIDSAAVNVGGDGNYIYTVGTREASKNLLDISKSIGEKFYSGMRLIQTDNMINNSDQAAFIAKGIPALFLFNGSYKGNHSFEDKVEYIQFPLLEKRSRLVFSIVWDLAFKGGNI